MFHGFIPFRKEPIMCKNVVEYLHMARGMAKPSKSHFIGKKI